MWAYRNYIDLINELKTHGLWNFDDGILFMPFLQYALPKPNIYFINETMKILESIGLDTDWFPLEKMRILRKKLPIQYRNSRGYLDIHYPVAHAIRVIYNLSRWEDEQKAELIKKLLRLIYITTTGRRLFDSDIYYKDVYMIRDIMICIEAKKHNIKITSGTHNKNLKIKNTRFIDINNRKRWLGSASQNDKKRYKSDWAWSNPPHIPFTFSTHENLIQDFDQGSNQNQSVSQYSFEYELDELGGMPDFEQESFTPRLLAKWSRQNIRSEADSHALGWNQIFSFWDFLLRKKRYPHFILSLLAFSTGIPKSRWQLISEDSSELHNGGLLLNSVEMKLVYRVQNIATDFSDLEVRKETHPSQCIQLALPNLFEFVGSTLVFTEMVKQGLKEESSLRGFSRKHGGPTPGLNRVSRSGHIILRREICGELNSHRLSGQIPIELQNRSYYQAISNQNLNSLFQQTLSRLVQKSTNFADIYPALSACLSSLDLSTCGTTSDHLIGSQITEVPLDTFHPPKLPPLSEASTLKVVIQAANKMEHYYFWMRQFGLATRSTGIESQSTTADRFAFHSDKNSDSYEESKVLIVPELLQEQLNELLRMRESLNDYFRFWDFCLDLDPEDHRALRYKIRGTKSLRTDLLTSQHALAFAKEEWNFKPPFQRGNAHRHYCATSVMKTLGESFSDVWLGHHVDGWDAFAPDASGNLHLLEKLAESGNIVLRSLGFRLLRSPW